MIGWILLAVILLLAALSFVLRLGALVGMGGDGFFVKLRIGPGYLQVFPRKTDPKKQDRKKRKKAEKKARKQARKEKKAKKGEGKPPKPKKKINVKGLLAMVWDLLPVVKDAADRFTRALRIDRMELDLLWGGKDPADAAIRYGQIWAAVETLLAFLENGFPIRERKVSMGLDLSREKPRILGQAGVSLTLAQLTGIGVIAGVRGLRIFLAHRKELFTKETQDKPRADVGAEGSKGEEDHGKQSSHQRPGGGDHPEDPGDRGREHGGR